MERLVRRNSAGSAIPNNGFGGLVDKAGQEIINKLCEFEDAEEQGLLKWMPCKVGDEIYKTKAVFSYFSKPMEDRIDFIKIYKDEIVYVCTSETKFSTSAIGKTVFLTLPEAQAALEGEKE